MVSGAHNAVDAERVRQTAHLHDGRRRAEAESLNYPEAVAVISAVALDGARAGKTIEDVTKDARIALTKADVMDGVADLIPMVQIEAVFTDGSRLVTVHTPIQ